MNSTCGDYSSAISVGARSTNKLKTSQRNVAFQGAIDVQSSSEVSLVKSLKKRANASRFKSSLDLKRKHVREDRSLMTQLNDLISS